MFVLNNINQNLYICCLNLDLSKTCNTVGGDIFLNIKYCKFEICGKPLDLLTSYEINRYQYTNVRHFTSSKINHHAGYPRDIELARYLLYCTLMAYGCFSILTLYHLLIILAR